MKIKVLFIFFSVCLLSLSGRLTAQISGSDEGKGYPDPWLSQKDNDYLDRQARVFLDSVSRMLSIYPPAFHEGKERGFAKLLMDAVFHEKYAAFRKPVQDFFHERVNHVIEDLETTTVENGIQIWKIYNMGFIARTKTVTLAFDLVSGISSRSEDFALTQKQIENIVNQCDVLFISHRHADHAEKRVAEKFVEKGLPVVAPVQIWTGDSIHLKVIHPERIVHKVQKLKLDPTTLDIVVYPGHQMSSIDNNVYLVKTPEGITLAHLGDQINENDFMIDYGWIDQVNLHHQIDILMPNAWTMDIFRIVRGFNPKLVLPGHELELGHTVWDRLPYWGDDEYLGLNYADLKKSAYPVVVLIWGEGFQYYQK